MYLPSILFTCMYFGNLNKHRCASVSKTPDIRRHQKLFCGFMISPSKVTVFLLQLDLYNQRILEKREQQYKEMLAWKKEKGKDGTLVAPGITTFLYTKLNHPCLNYTHF